MLMLSALLVTCIELLFFTLLSISVWIMHWSALFIHNSFNAVTWNIAACANALFTLYFTGTLLHNTLNSVHCSSPADQAPLDEPHYAHSNSHQLPNSYDRCRSFCEEFVVLSPKGQAALEAATKEQSCTLRHMTRHLRVTASNVKRVPKRENTERLNAFVHLEAKFHGKLRHKIRAQIWGNCTSSMFKKYRYISVAVRGASQHCASLAVSQPRWHLWRWCSTWNKMPNSHRVPVFDTGREIWCQICAWWSCALPKW